MPEEDNNESQIPDSPVLESPKKEQVVDHSDVTLEWQPVEGAEEYRVQLAANSDFEELLLDEKVGEKSKFKIESELPSDGSTLYWRVLARKDDKWSRGQRIESFVSATPEATEEVEDVSRPEEEEELGPSAELFSAAAEGAAVDVIGDEEDRDRLARERDIGVAEEGIESGQILAIVAVIVTAVILIVFVLFFWVDNVTRTARDAVVGLSGYPHLQEQEIEAQRRLGQYEVIDPDEGVYRIPIDRAMELVLQDTYTDEGINLPLQPRERVLPEVDQDDFRSMDIPGPSQPETQQ